MVAKIMAGVVAALLVTGAGMYVATSGDSDPDPGTTETLAVSEGSCCALKAKLACETTPAAGSSDALAACAGPAVLAVSAKPAGATCCCEE